MSKHQFSTTFSLFETHFNIDQSGASSEMVIGLSSERSSTKCAVIRDKNPVIEKGNMDHVTIMPVMAATEK